MKTARVPESNYHFFRVRVDMFNAEAKEAEISVSEGELEDTSFLGVVSVR